MILIFDIVLKKKKIIIKSERDTLFSSNFLVHNFFIKLDLPTSFSPTTIIFKVYNYSFPNI